MNKKIIFITIIMLSVVLGIAFYSKQEDINLTNIPVAEEEKFESSIPEPPLLNDSLASNKNSPNIAKKIASDVPSQQLVNPNSFKEASDVPKYIIEASSDEILEYEENVKCEIFFHMTIEDIDDILIETANLIPTVNQEMLERDKHSVKDRLVKCKPLIDKMNFEQFLDLNESLLRKAASEGNSVAQLRLASMIGQRELFGYSLTPSEKRELYDEHLSFLQASSANGNPEAKILLAYAFLDTIRYPENFNLDSARHLHEEASFILGNELSSLKEKIDSL